MCIYMFFLINKEYVMIFSQSTDIDPAVEEFSNQLSFSLKW